MSDNLFPEPAGFNQLSKADQVRYVQMLWDKIADNADDIAVPDSHWLELQARLADYRSQPENVAPARDVLDRLASKQRK